MHICMNRRNWLKTIFGAAVATVVGVKTIPAVVAAPSPLTAYYCGKKFKVHFSKITTPEFTKGVDNLRTCDLDLRALITNNAVKDIQNEEDRLIINYE